MVHYSKRQAESLEMMMMEDCKRKIQQKRQMLYTKQGFCTLDKKKGKKKEIWEIVVVFLKEIF